MKKGKKIQRTYTNDEKESLLKRMLPPENCSLTQLSNETGISKSTLSSWKIKAREISSGVLNKQGNGKDVSALEKFIIVMETYTMTEIQLSEYCRTKGIFVEQVKNWRETCINANEFEPQSTKELRIKIQEEQKKTKALEKELTRKDKALAETAALLVLRKKLEAIWGDSEEE